LLIEEEELPALLQEVFFFFVTLEPRVE